jgi:hypothetical protein
MANVVADAEVTAEPFLRNVGGLRLSIKVVLEELHDIAGPLKGATRLGLDTEADVPPRPFLDVMQAVNGQGERPDETPEVVRRRLRISPTQWQG